MQAQNCDKMPPGVQKRADKALAVLRALYPAPAPNLTAAIPWQLLAATVLSAQCTDERVNQVTPELFRRWPDPAAMAGADPAQVEEVVRPTGFYRNKARNLVAGAARIVRDYGGETPCELDKLLTIEGVARKTANVVLWGAFGKNEGLAVDTHVQRIARRLGLTESENPAVSERDLMKIFPRDEWGLVNHRMVLFGRAYCAAKKPACRAGGECPMREFCPRVGL